MHETGEAPGSRLRVLSPRGRPMRTRCAVDESWLKRRFLLVLANFVSGTASSPRAPSADHAAVSL